MNEGPEKNLKKYIHRWYKKETKHEFGRQYKRKRKKRKKLLPENGKFFIPRSTESTISCTKFSRFGRQEKKNWSNINTATDKQWNSGKQKFEENIWQKLLKKIASYSMKWNNRKMFQVFFCLKVWWIA